MESRPIPIEELKCGEFYDIQIINENPSFLGALLLEQLPKNRVKLMLVISDFDHFNAPYTQLDRKKRSWQIETMRLGPVYPYLTFTHLPDEILRWPDLYEGEELITQIKEEIRRIMSEGCWTFNLPHFCEGYLHVYLSYIAYRGDTPNGGEVLNLWFEFMGSYFSALRDHFLRVQVLSEKTDSGLLEARKVMEQLSERSWQIKECVTNPSFTLKAMKLADMKKSCFDTYRPIELYPGSFNRLWELTSRQYGQDFPTGQMQKFLHLRTLFRNPNKLFEILSSYPDFARYLMELNIQELPSEEILRMMLRIAVSARLLGEAVSLILASEESVEESPCIILVDESMLLSCSEKLQDLVMNRADLAPSIIAYLKSLYQGNFQLSDLLKNVTAQILVEDWQFITFLIGRRILMDPAIRGQINTQETGQQIRELVMVALEHNMSVKLLSDLLSCEVFGPLVFPALVEGFSLPHCREMMVAYLAPEKWHNYVTDPQAIYRQVCYLKELTGRIAAEDWELVTFVIQNDLIPAYSSSVDCQKMYKCVKDLVRVALVHKMSPELLRNLLPCVDYGHLVFPALASGFTVSRSRQMMLIYFRSEQRCLDVAREVVRTCSESPRGISSRYDRLSYGYATKKAVHEYMKGEKLDLWYVFGGSVQIQFIWIIQFAHCSIKRLSPVLAREICGYLA